MPHCFGSSPLHGLNRPGSRLIDRGRHTARFEPSPRSKQTGEPTDGPAARARRAVHVEQQHVEGQVVKNQRFRLYVVKCMLLLVRTIVSGRICILASTQVEFRSLSPTPPPKDLAMRFLSAWGVWGTVIRSISDLLNTPGATWAMCGCYRMLEWPKEAAGRGQ